MARINLRLTGPMDQLSIVWQTGEVLLADVPFEQDPEMTRQNVLLSLQEMVTVLGDVCQRCKDTPVNTIACKRCSRRAACSHPWCCVSGRGLR